MWKTHVYSTLYMFIMVFLCMPIHISFLYCLSRPFGTKQRKHSRISTSQHDTSSPSNNPQVWASVWGQLEPLKEGKNLFLCCCRHPHHPHHHHHHHDHHHNTYHHSPSFATMLINHSITNIIKLKSCLEHWVISLSHHECLSEGAMDQNEKAFQKQVEQRVVWQGCRMVGNGAVESQHVCLKVVQMNAPKSSTKTKRIV